MKSCIFPPFRLGLLDFSLSRLLLLLYPPHISPTAQAQVSPIVTPYPTHTYTRQLKPKSPPVSPQTRTYTRTAWNILVGIVRSKVIVSLFFCQGVSSLPELGQACLLLHGALPLSDVSDEAGCRKHELPCQCGRAQRPQTCERQGKWPSVSSHVQNCQWHK